MQLDVTLVRLPAKIQVKLPSEPEPVDIFRFYPEYERDEILAWFDEQIKARLDDGTVEQYLVATMQKDLFLAGVIGYPEGYPHKPWPVEKFRSDLTPFQKAKREYKRVFNETIAKPIGGDNDMDNG